VRSVVAPCSRIRLQALVRRLVATTMALVLAACGESTAPSTVDSVDALPRALTAVEREAISGGNEFALSLLRHSVSGETGNVLLSPLSAWTALGMTMNGASGTTEAEMRSALGWGTRTRQEINTAYRDLAALLPTLDPSVTVKNANGIWVRDGVTIDSGFALDARSYFGANVRSLPTPRAMFDAVNVWGNEQTDGMIPRVLTGDPPDDLLMLLANAVLFDGQWRERLDPAKTRDAPFRLESGASANVPMMQRQGGFNGFWAQDVIAVEMPYGNSAYSMLMLVPTTGTVDAFVAQLDASRLASYDAAIRPLPSNHFAYVPRFSVSGSLELRPMLEAMGMVRAFTDAAEFPRLLGPVRARLDFVKHGVRVEVDERGTRAAAVTVVGAVPVSLPPEYRVDRPFVFLIRERFAGTILFAGVVRDPR